MAVRALIKKPDGREVRSNSAQVYGDEERLIVVSVVTRGGIVYQSVNGQNPYPITLGFKETEDQRADQVFEELCHARSHTEPVAV